MNTLKKTVAKTSMTKLDWNKLNRLDKVDHYHEAIVENQKKSKVKKPKSIKLGEHEKHDIEYVMVSSGPHKGKAICKTCNGKFVTWIPKSF